MISCARGDGGADDDDAPDDAAADAGRAGTETGERASSAITALRATSREITVHTSTRTRLRRPTRACAGQRVIARDWRASTTPTHDMRHHMTP
jgi:hypothetical protein